MYIAHNLTYYAYGSSLASDDIIIYNYSYWRRYIIDIAFALCRKK